MIQKILEEINMTDNKAPESIDKIAEQMVKEIDIAEEKDKEIESSVQTPDEEPQDPDAHQEIQEDTKHLYTKKKLKKLQNENERIIEEARLIAEENIALRNQYEAALTKAQTSSDAAMAHYQDGINLRVAQLKEELKRAHENNDIDSITDINFQLGMLASEAKDIKAHNLLQSQYQQQQQQQYYPNYYPQQYIPPAQNYSQQPNVEVKKETKDWVKRNPWLIEGHEDYDPDKVQEVLAYSRILDLNLQRNGQEDLLHSPDYYNALDQYINSSFGEEIPPQPSPPPQRNVQPSFSNESRAPIAPVRKSSSGNYNSPHKTPQFSDLDEDLMKGFSKFGVTRDSYGKAKKEITEQYKQAAQAGDLNALQKWGLI